MQFTLLDAAANTAQQGETTQGGGLAGLLPMLLYLVVIGLVLYFVMIRPQRKRQKEEEKMRNSIEVGDEIITIGGLYGRVISVKEDSIVLESQSDHSKQRLARWAIQQNLTVHDDVETDTPKKSRKKEKDV